MEGVKLLICEDEGLVALDLERRLTKMGYEVVGTAPEGEQAFALAEQLRPDCILMDIQLEGGSPGTEVAAVIQHELNIPSIYLTAYSGAKTIEKAQIANPVGYLVKPVSDRDLHIAIRMGMAQHRARLKLKEDLERSAQQLRDIHGQLTEVSSKLRNNTRMNSLQEIINGISHHFNNSLQALIGSLDLLERQGELPPAQLETVRFSMQACENHYHFIRRLKWASGRAQLKLKAGEIQKLLHQCIDEIRDSLPRDIEICADFESTPIELRMDEEALRHAIRALLSNSVEASPKSSKILVTLNVKMQEAPEIYNPVAAPGWFCAVSIIDNGGGIDAELMERVTEPFFSTRSARLASGLGLTEACGIALAHHGWLTINSKPNIETSVRIFLPLDRPLGAVLS